MNLESTVNEIKGIQEKLKEFNNENDAIKYLVDETKLSTKECTKAYKFIMNLDLNELENN